SGQERWHRSLPTATFAWPVIGDGTLYFASAEQRPHCIEGCPHKPFTDYLCAIDAGTGAETWTVAVNNGTGSFTNMVLDRATLYLTTFEPNYLQAFDAHTGRKEWEFETEAPSFGAPAVADGVIYLGVFTGRIYAMLPPGYAAVVVTPGTVPSSGTVGGQTLVTPATGGQEAPSVGYRAPDFSLVDLRDQQLISLSALRGKPVFLNFWSTLSRPSAAEMADIETVYAQHDGEAAFVGIASKRSGDYLALAKYLEQNQFSWTFPFDPSGTVASKYQVESYPTSFFIDKEGLIRAIHIGQMDPDEIAAKLKEIP
ncbi:MAG TPA: redoxin domain-containing protein, partial [Chloroflexia bacterium]|nr:redoxin domain-containing protein [Chloroflexia bacterium]